jgi:2-keto-4-pentenoate hydratase/2-oxohepta-3-ene-1,7-dioic acid hydratase in catechol pathway
MGPEGISTLQYRSVPQYIRYRSDSAVSYGILDGETVREIHGDLFQSPAETGVTHKLSDVKLLHPCEPGKIMAVGLNYRSHLGSRPQPSHPEIFYKPVSALQDPEAPIVIPRDATDLHYEGELVIVMGKRAKNVSVEQARDAIFGVTCGNDVSERNWQHGTGKDLQWWRAKGCDTFAPLGPVIATGIDYSNLLLQTRLNGEVVQKQTTGDLLFDCPAIVARISGWVTLLPGDAIYTGTPGATRKLSAGDVVEVEIESIGVLRNPVVAG